MQIMDHLSSIHEDINSFQSADVPQVDVWDTGKTREQEYRLHPDPSIDEISSRLFNQVVQNHTWAGQPANLE